MADAALGMVSNLCNVHSQPAAKAPRYWEGGLLSLGMEAQHAAISDRAAPPSASSPQGAPLPCVGASSPQPGTVSGRRAAPPLRPRRWEGVGAGPWARGDARAPPEGAHAASTGCGGVMAISVGSSTTFSGIGRTAAAALSSIAAERAMRGCRGRRRRGQRAAAPACAAPIGWQHDSAATSQAGECVCSSNGLQWRAAAAGQR